MGWPKSARVVEVGMRDGLQIEKTFVPTEDKVKLLRMLENAGIRWIQATSFVHPKWVPQMADAEALMAAIRESPGAEYNALVPNERGYDRAMAAGIRHVEIIVGVTDGFARHNTNMSSEEALAQARVILAKSRKDGVEVRVGLTVALGCPYEGQVPTERVVDFAQRSLEAGAAEVVIADTIGTANPRQVYEVCSRVAEVVPPERLVAHFHDTWGRGLANVVTALQAGITAFDASVGGLGGCPFCPGAAGNIATEDLVSMLEEMGIPTGVDLGKLLGAAELAQSIVGHPLPTTHVLVAGRNSCSTPT